jgi:hypothetical protein
MGGEVMSTTLKSILRDAAVSLLDSRDRVEAKDVVQRARMRHGHIFEREQERLLMEAAGRIAKQIMKELSENDEPPLIDLFGLAVPTAIAVPKEEGGFYYVRTDKATWSQLVAGEQTRAANVERALAKLDGYRESMAYLRPAMEHHPSRTVAEAMKVMRGSVA